MKNDAIVQLKDVGRTFDDVVAVEKVDGEVRSGEVVGIIGPNGGGKSTLLMMIAGLVRPTSGNITIEGVPAHELARQVVGTVGLVTARPGLYPLLTGLENLEYFASLYGLDRDEITARAEPLLERFDLKAAMNTRLSTWSTGMQQRLSLIRALITRPRLLLFDEPTANLDPIGEAELHAELRRQADQGMACVLVTHRLMQAESICDRVWFLDRTVIETVELDAAGYEPPSGPLFDMWKARK